MTSQNYEAYWKITLAYTDIFADEFNEVLNIIIHFIDRNYNVAYSDAKYKKLQKAINQVFPKSEVSIRKVINTYIKLGFINPRLESYCKDSPAFLRETKKEKKKTIFSKIVYSNSSFDRSVTRFSKKREINFLIQTLNEVGKLDKTDVLALMTKNIARIRKGYLNKEELSQAKRYVDEIGFASRKYNQVGHLWRILANLDNLNISHKYIYLEDAKISDSDAKGNIQKRDPYLQIIYKNELKEESMQVFGRIQCMLEKLDYPPCSLIASHIKPFCSSSKDEAYDVNNGLLLSRNMDKLFDDGYISFKENGSIILSTKLTRDMRNYLKNFSLNNVLMTSKRKIYLSYHRRRVFTS